MSEPQANPVSWLWRKHAGLISLSLAVALVTPYLSALPIRCLPLVVSLAQGVPATTGELSWLGNAASSLPAVIAVLVTAGFLAFVATLLATRLASALTTRAIRDLRLALHDHYLAEGQGGADLVRVAILEQSRTVASYTCTTLPATFGVGFATLVWGQTLYAALAGASRGLALIVVVGTVLVLVSANLTAVFLTSRQTQAAQKQIVGAQAEMSRLVSESIDCRASLLAFGAEADQTDRLRTLVDTQARAERQMAAWTGLSTALSSGLLLVGMPLFVLAWIGFALPAERLAVMLPALLMLQRTLTGVGSLWTARAMARPAIELIAKRLPPGRNNEVTSVTSAPHDAKGTSVDALRFRAVSVTHHERSTLHHCTFDLAPSEHVALVGRGGSGKSTVLRAALGLQVVSEGTIEIAARPLTDWPRRALREYVGLLEQHPPLFTRTLRDNLLLGGREANERAIHDALERSRFAEVAARFPRGLHEPLTSANNTLSGSERRRLGLARLLLRNPKLVLIDELEAGLPQRDAETLWHDIREHFSAATILLVTHRPDLLATDRILLLENGHITHSGTHAQLLADVSYYRDLLAQPAKEPL